MKINSAIDRFSRTPGVQNVKTAALLVAALSPAAIAQADSVAALWNTQLIEAIRVDTPRPTVHARNLFHVSGATYDAWAAFDSTANGWLFNQDFTAADAVAAQEEAMSYAAYGLLNHRFATSPGAATSLSSFTTQMSDLGYDPTNTSTVGNSPAAIGNRIAQSYINYGMSDGAFEAAGYVDANYGYAPVNDPLVVAGSAISVNDPNRWQPLTVEVNGSNVTQDFLTPHWGDVTPFAISRADGTSYAADLLETPPQFGTDAFKEKALEVLRFSAVLDPDLSPTINISPSQLGNSPLGTNANNGHAINPSTGVAYPDNEVNLGDYGRVLAEFWADGPQSETPPGHWNVIAQEVSEHPQLVRQIGGVGPVVSELEWDTKLQFALNAAVYDAGVAAWDLKHDVDYVRPITMIRHMSSLGQSSDSNLPNYHADGIPLEAGLVELVTAETAAAGGRHEGLPVDSIAVLAWAGPVEDDEDYAGVDWIAGVDWMPYQAEDFVTPGFSGYISGHSTFSRAAAEILASFTGDDYFPGGVGEFEFVMNAGLNFEEGPAEDILLQWATYYDAADEAGISRLYGGIHVEADDLDGRITGDWVGTSAWSLASGYFDGTVPEPASAALVLLGAAGLVGRRRKA